MQMKGLHVSAILPAHHRVADGDTQIRILHAVSLKSAHTERAIKRGFRTY